MSDCLSDLDIVALLKGLPEEGLTAGQAGTIGYVHDRHEAFEVEFILEPRRSIVATVEREHLLKLKGLGYSKAG